MYLLVLVYFWNNTKELTNTECRQQEAMVGQERGEEDRCSTINPFRSFEF